MFAVDDIDETLERFRERGAQLVSEVGEHKDADRLCYIRWPERADIIAYCVGSATRPPAPPIFTVTTSRTWLTRVQASLDPSRDQSNVSIEPSEKLVSRFKGPPSSG
jgi:hypothetical protein